MLGFILERGLHLLAHELLNHESEAEKIVRKYIGDATANADMSIYEARLDIRGLRQELSNKGIWIDNPTANMPVRKLIELVDKKMSN